MYSSQNRSEHSVLSRSSIQKSHNRCAVKITLSKEIRYSYRQLHQNHKKTNTIITTIRAVAHIIHIVVAIQAIKIMIHTIRYGINFNIPFTLDFFCLVQCLLLSPMKQKKNKPKTKQIKFLQIKKKIMLRT